MTSVNRIVCVSNRLPITVIEEPDRIDLQPSSGGLVTAMAPVLRKCRGVWIGWPGEIKSEERVIRKALSEFSSRSEFDLIPVLLDKNAIEKFYYGFSNQVIWPLFHELQSRCNFEPEFWSTYLEVQQVFCDEVVKHIRPGDLIWIHDYHLMGVARLLRERNVINTICFFLHTPFPGYNIFSKLPSRSDVIDSLINCNLIGFQTDRDLRHFADAVESLLEVKCDKTSSGVTVVNLEQQECKLGSFPVSIDFAEFDDMARLPEVEANAQKIRADMNVEYIILSIDRLDYTKGIPDRIKSFKRLFELSPELKKRIALLQVIVPSRVEVPEYRALLADIEQLVSQVNGRFGEPGWVPVHHLFRNLTREDVVAMYRASDIALVTPLKDGMNLVAKEYCASRINDCGMLVLSEFAGAADELKEFAFMVNPYDVDGVAQTLANLVSVTPEDAIHRMKEMRRIIKEHDVYAWASTFLAEAGWNWNECTDMSQTTPSLWERLRNIMKVFDQ